MAWQLIGTATITPSTPTVELGTITVPSAGGVEIKLRQVDETPFSWGFGLLSYRSAYGRELGTIQVWPRLEFTSYRLGADLTVVDNTGVLIFEPRANNLRWVVAGFPLTVEVLADIPADFEGDAFLADGFTTDSGTALTLTAEGSAGLLTFSS